MRHWKIRRFPSSTSRKTMNSPWTLAFHKKHVAFVAFRSSSFRHLDLKHLDLPQEMARKVALVPMPQAFCDRINPMIRCPLLSLLLITLSWGCPPKKKTRPFAGDKARKFIILWGYLLIFVDIFLQASNPSMQPYNSSTCVDLWRGISWLAWANVSRRGVFPSVVWELPCICFFFAFRCGFKTAGHLGDNIAANFGVYLSFITFYGQPLSASRALHIHGWENLLIPPPSGRFRSLRLRAEQRLQGAEFLLVLSEVVKRDLADLADAEALEQLAQVLKQHVSGPQWRWLRIQDDT